MNKYSNAPKHFKIKMNLKIELSKWTGILHLTVMT